MGVDPSGVLDKATWGIATRMWWWQWWRFISYLCLGGIVLGLIGMLLAVILMVMGVQKGAVGLTVLILMAMVGLPGCFMLSLYLCRKMIGKSFNGLTLVLLKNEEAHPPVMVDPTWGMAIKMWWWMGWRALVLGMLLSILDGVIGFIIGNQLWFQIPITLLSVLFGIYWYQKIIGQSFGGVTLVLLKPDQTA